MKNSIRLFSVLYVILAVLPGKAYCNEKDFTAIINGVNDKFELIETISVNITRISKKGNDTVEENWNYYYKKPDKMRVEYLKPHRRYISLNEKQLIEYIPAIKNAAVFDVNGINEDEKVKLIKNVFSRVSIPGLRLGEVKRGRASIRSVKMGEFDAYFIDNMNPVYQIWVDKDSGALLKHIIYNKNGETIYSTHGRNFKRFKGDILIPQNITLVMPDEKEKDKIIRSEMTLRNLKVNEGLKDELFKIELDKDVKILK